MLLARRSASAMSCCTSQVVPLLDHAGLLQRGRELIGERLQPPHILRREVSLALVDGLQDADDPLLGAQRHADEGARLRSCLDVNTPIEPRILVHVRHDQRLAFANHPSGDALPWPETGPPQPRLMPCAGIIGDFEVQLLARFIEQDDGHAFDLEQRDGALDGESHEMVEVVDGGERLDVGPLPEIRPRLDEGKLLASAGGGVVTPACAAWAKARRARSTAGRSCGWARAVCRSR